MPKPHRLPQPGDTIRITGDNGQWRVLTVTPRGRGHQITATSLTEYPRVDCTTATTNTRPVGQE